MSYDPTIGRFISEDPIAFDGGDANLYRYVGNDPVNATDPSGLLKKTTIGVMSPYHPRPKHWIGPWPPPLPPFSRAGNDVLKKIYPIAQDTWIWDFAPEGCERWAFEFEKNLKGFSHPDVKSCGLGWEKSGAIGGGHAIYEFILYDGTIIQVDHWIYYGGTRITVIE